MYYGFVNWLVDVGGVDDVVFDVVCMIVVKVLFVVYVVKE